MQTLQDAVALIKAGDRQGGQRLLAEILAQDPANEAAWLWMSSVVEQDEQRQYCLKQILKHNPGHAVARAALTRLQEPEAGEAAPQSPGGPAEPSPAPGQAQGWQPQEARGSVRAQAPADRAPAWQSPAPPARDPAMMKDMADFVIEQLGKHETPDNIALKLCEVSGMSWSEVTAFIEGVEKERRPEIVSRRRPILLLVGVVTLVAGLYLGYTSASYLAAFFATAGDFSENPLIYILSTPGLARRVVTLAIATAIIVGGLWGTVRALMPPGEQSTLESGVAGAGYGSIDDVMGLDIHIGGQTVAPSGRRSRRTW